MRRGLVAAVERRHQLHDRRRVNKAGPPWLNSYCCCWRIPCLAQKTAAAAAPNLLHRNSSPAPPPLSLCITPSLLNTLPIPLHAVLRSSPHPLSRLSPTPSATSALSFVDLSPADRPSWRQSALRSLHALPPCSSSTACPDNRFSPHPDSDRGSRLMTKAPWP